MAKEIKVGDWIVTPEFDYEVNVTGVDKGTGDLIIAYVLVNGQTAYKTVPRKTAKPFTPHYDEPARYGL